MTPSEFKTRFPEFAAETDERIQLFIDDAAPHFDEERWADLYPAGVANFVAHELTLVNAQTALGGGVKALTNDSQTKRVGDVTVTKDSALLGKQADNPFYRTLYGQKYLLLLGRIRPGVMAV